MHAWLLSLSCYLSKWFYFASARMGVLTYAVKDCLWFVLFTLNSKLIFSLIIFSITTLYSLLDVYYLESISGLPTPSYLNLFGVGRRHWRFWLKEKISLISFSRIFRTHDNGSSEYGCTLVCMLFVWLLMKSLKLKKVQLFLDFHAKHLLVKFAVDERLITFLFIICQQRTNVLSISIWP